MTIVLYSRLFSMFLVPLLTCVSIKQSLHLESKHIHSKVTHDHIHHHYEEKEKGKNQSQAEFRFIERRSSRELPGDSLDKQVRHISVTSYAHVIIFASDACRKIKTLNSMTVSITWTQLKMLNSGRKKLNCLLQLKDLQRHSNEM